jgi:ABC-type sugar transport system ATPase subunit
MVTIKLKNAHKEFVKNDTCLTDINLTVKAGEFLVVLGPSGCGKTTLLRLVAGLEKLSSGEIFFNEVLVNKRPAHKRKVSMVFQENALFSFLNVYDNLAFALKSTETPTEIIDEKITKIAQLLKIKELFSRSPNELSGGEAQRVAMAKALIKKPDIFLLDEPLSSIDTNHKLELRAEIQRLHTKIGATIIMVTHNYADAYFLADRIAILDPQGSIQQVDTPQNILQQPANTFVNDFFCRHFK